MLRNVKGGTSSLAIGVLMIALANSAVADPLAPFVPLKTDTPVTKDTVADGKCSGQFTNLINQYTVDANKLSSDATKQESTANGLDLVTGTYDVASSAADAALMISAGSSMTAAGVAVGFGGVNMLVPIAGSVAASPFMVTGGTALGVAGGVITSIGAKDVADTANDAAKLASYSLNVAASAQNELAVKATDAAMDLQLTADSLDSCNETFTGSVVVEDGGISVNGASVFKSDVNFESAIGLKGGLSAFDGEITIGNADLTTHEKGIAIGGGAFAGAGTGGTPATTGDASAIAIGNGANSAAVDSLALGTAASSTGEGATAIGRNSLAEGDDSVALGSEASATGESSIAIGESASATELGSIAAGLGSSAEGESATAIGHNASASALGAVAMGLDASANAEQSTAVGAGSQALADGATAVGAGAMVFTAAGPGSFAGGNSRVLSGLGAVAIGSGSTASGNGSVALGAGATVNGHNQSTAIGANATTTADNQIMMGTKSETIIAPGMNSSTSRDRQVGRLGVVTSDNYGNIASDNGALYSELASLKTGVVMSMALGDPILSGDDRFAVKMNTSAFDGSYGIGVTAAAVLHDRDATLIVSGGVAWAQANEFGYSRDQGAARASMQISW